MSSTSPRAGHRIDLDEAHAVLSERYEAGDRDISGGVPSCTMTEDFGVSQAQVALRMRRLIDAGRAETVRGLEPETYRPRPSYIPIATTENDSR